MDSLLCSRTVQSLVAAIRARRIELGLSQERLALRCGVHRNTVRLLESGQTDTTVLTLTRVLVCLGADRLRLGSVELTFAAEDDGRSELTGIDPTDTKHLLRALGAAIATRRRAAGLSQERLAELAGLHHNTICEIERGEEDPAMTTVLRIYEALQVREIVAEPNGPRLQ